MKFEQVKSDVPKLIKISERAPKFVKIKIQTSKPTAALILLTILFIVLIISIFITVAIGSEYKIEGLHAFLLLISVFIITIIITSIVLKPFVPSCDIQISPEAITIGKKNYDRRLWGGFRPGIQQTVGPHSVVNLNFIYGGVEEKTHHHVLDEEAIKVINFLNDQIDEITHTETAALCPETGNRKQQFE